MSPKRYPSIDQSIVRSLSEVLGRTEGGLSNKEINELFAAARIRDPTPAAPPGTYVAISKRDRLHNALTAQQSRDGCGNAVLAFVAKALAPVRFHDSPEEFDSMRAEVNVPLAFAGYQIDDAGKLRPKPQAKTLSEAQRRAMQLRSQLVDRGAHPRLLRYCISEIDDDNYFHAVLEASKSLADEIRRRTGHTEDGVPLIDAVFEIGKRGHPLLALSNISTETERSRQSGLANSLRGVFGSLRNPAAHEPKIKSTMTEKDAVDEICHMSFLHRRLDECHECLRWRQPPSKASLIAMSTWTESDEPVLRWLQEQAPSFLPETWYLQLGPGDSVEPPDEVPGLNSEQMDQALTRLQERRCPR